MGRTTSTEAVTKAIEANEEICQRYQEEFDARVANQAFSPENTRMEELERLWHKARQDADAVYSRLTESLIESINEDAVIESKKESMRKGE